MATQKPISTISYNTVPFLKEKLDGWVSSHWLQAYQFLPHKGEDGDRDHTHVRVEPNKKLDPMELSAALTEYVVGEDKPRLVRPWRPSKEEDWFLYVIHDADYLSGKYDKGEKLPYDWHDIVVPDNYDLETAIIRAKAKILHSTPNLTKRLESGESALELIKTGENPFTVNAVLRALTDDRYTSLRTELNRVSSEYAILRSRYDYLVEQLENVGYHVSDDGTIHN